MRVQLAGLSMVLVLLSVAPAARAGAAHRYAAEDATDTVGPCLADSPCRIDHAINDASTGDTVTVLSGDYSTSQHLVVPEGVAVEGPDGGPRPTITFVDPGTTELMAVDSGGGGTTQV